MTNPIILDGKKLAEKIKVQLKNKVELYKEKPGLGIIFVGNRIESSIYVNLKKKACNNLGIENYDVYLEDNASQESIIKEINKMNLDKKIDAILVQLPLPKHINEREVLNTISLEKDVEGFHLNNIANLTLNNNYLAPCTCEGCILLLKEYDIDLKGKHVVIIGKSNVVGLPLSLLCLHENATVTICHIYTENLKNITNSADILIVACGKANLITSEYIKNDCIIIDIGINKISDSTNSKGYKIVGDVNYNDVINKIKAITPVPGGIGPMTIAILLKNTLLLAEKNKL